jgi:SulP family sulfate permease
MARRSSAEWRSRLPPLLSVRPAAGDLVAGVTVALVLLPQSLAYAQLAGMPPERGLYAAAVAPLAAAAFASSPYLQTGPVALTSLLVLGALSGLAPVGGAEYVTLGVLLALVVGVVRLALGLLRAGVIAYLISQPMLLGFVPAAAIVIVATQLPAAVGVEPDVDGIFGRAWWTVAHLGSWETPSAVLAGLVVALIVGGRYVHRLFPSIVLAVVIGLAYSSLSDYDGATVGRIPTVLPPLSLHFPWADLSSLLLPGLVIALVGFVEPSSIARTFASADRARWDPDRELISQGAANAATAVGGGFPVGGSFSRSALNRRTGARTAWSGAVTGAAVLLFLPFASALEPLPMAVLGAIVIGSVLGHVRLLPLLRLERISRSQFGVAATTFALTLALAPRVDQAIVVGGALAIAVHLRRELALEIPGWIDGDALHLRPRGVLWFGSAGRLEDTLVALLAEHADATRLVVHLDGLGRIDTTGALALRELLQEARESGLTVEIVDVRPRWRSLVEHVIEARQDPLGRA